jgi:hypothetical protein
MIDYDRPHSNTKPKKNKIWRMNKITTGLDYLEGLDTIFGSYWLEYLLCLFALDSHTSLLQDLLLCLLEIESH